MSVLIASEGAHDLGLLSSPEGKQHIDIGKQIFCNTAVNMKNVVAVGFDMDYTLAKYKVDTFESLTYEGVVKKLITNLGYPQELQEWCFDSTYMVRGLVIDKKRGNILKMDLHKYVKIAYHGFSMMSKSEKSATYGNTFTKEAFDGPNYAHIDTFFSLAEMYLFAQLVDYKDSNPGKISELKDYYRIYADVRSAVDMCHRDGTLKKMVAKDPKKYINEDDSIFPMLKDSGRTVFLVTNSLWDYTNVVMNFLFGSRTMNDGSSLSFDWLKYFDVVVTGSAKPSFFHDKNRANLFAVEVESGKLINTVNGTPLAQVGGPAVELPDQFLNKHCKVFQGGNVGHLHKLLNVGSSSQVLYVGDHIYGDVLRSKKVLGWRTMLIVPEIEKEAGILSSSRETRKIISLLLTLLVSSRLKLWSYLPVFSGSCILLKLMRAERDTIEDDIHHFKWSLEHEEMDAGERKTLTEKLDVLEVQRTRARAAHQESQRTYHQKFHPVWGQLMKTGYQNSCFAHQISLAISTHLVKNRTNSGCTLLTMGQTISIRQNAAGQTKVERFACLYTSDVGNLGLYSPDKYYKPSENFMDHESNALFLNKKVL